MIGGLVFCAMVVALALASLCWAIVVLRRAGPEQAALAADSEAFERGMIAGVESCAVVARGVHTGDSDWRQCCCGRLADLFVQSSEDLRGKLNSAVMVHK